MTDGEIIITNEYDGQLMGRVAYYRLTGGVEHEVLAECLREQGFDDDAAPHPPTPDRALKRAFLKQASKRTLVRPLGADFRGYALVDERPKERSLEHGTRLTATIESEVDGDREKLVLTFDPPDHDLASVISTMWAEGLFELDTNDFSEWMTTRVLPAVGAISLRDRGGVYFIPSSALDLWDKYRAAIKEASDHTVFQIPAMKSEDAVEAVLDGLISEVQKEIDRMTADLEGDREMGKRALNTRVNRCDAALAKLGGYDSLLGDRLSKIKAQMEDLQAEFAAAALASTGEAPEEAA